MKRFFHPQLSGRKWYRYTVFPLLVLCCVTTYAKVLPVISDLKVIAGSRGVAVSLSADAPFRAVFSAKGKTARIRLDECVYGLSEFSYTDFPPAAPVRSVTARETASGSTDIEIVLKQSATLPVRAVQKRNQWMALLSKKAVSEYNWHAAGPSTASSSPSPPAKESPQREQPAGSTGKTSAGGILSNIRLLQRGQICELAFEFNTEVASSIRKKGTSVSFTAENIKNETGSRSLQLPDNSVFKKITISESMSDKTPLLTATITIDTTLAESNFNVAFTRGTVLSFFLMQRKQQKATLWTSGHGLEWDYRFYTVPSYNVDMEKLGSKARRDAQQRLSPEKTFAIKEQPSQTKPAEEEPRQQTEPAEPEPPPAPPVVTLPETPETTATMVVIGNKVNVRGAPTLNGRVRGKLKKGDTVYIVGTSDKWYKIHAENASGYLFSSLLRSVDMAVSVPSTIASAETTETPSSQTVQPDITPVATAISDDVYLSAHTSPEQDKNRNTTANPGKKAKSGIRYTGGGRDPFEPIVPSSISASGLPFAEHLRLVGVLFDDVDRIALCEDMQNDNRPFALREHDSIEKGKVLKIYQDKVVFLITEFGISRSFTLELSKVTDEQEVSKK
jgi:hypothetical protein